MDERADRVGPDDPERPRDQQNDGQGEQHILRRGVGRALKNEGRADPPPSHGLAGSCRPWPVTLAHAVDYSVRIGVRRAVHL